MSLSVNSSGGGGFNRPPVAYEPKPMDLSGAGGQSRNPGSTGSATGQPGGSTATGTGTGQGNPSPTRTEPGMNFAFNQGRNQQNGMFNNSFVI
jgi:hypothetical protein